MNETSSEHDQMSELAPPSAKRVAERALVMSVVACRGFIEQDASEATKFWNDVRAWFDPLNIAHEIEPWERQILDCPLGSLTLQLQANAQWLCEGAVVLAWALNKFEIPSHDQGVVAADVSNALGFLSPTTALENSSLRTQEEIKVLSEKLFAIHWRLRDFSLSQSAMDFREFARTAWFGPLDIEGVALIADDLAIDGIEISEADDHAVRICQSIAMERHRAVNWLLGYDAIYSEIDTST